MSDHRLRLSLAEELIDAAEALAEEGYENMASSVRRASEYLLGVFPSEMAAHAEMAAPDEPIPFVETATSRALSRSEPFAEACIAPVG